MSDFEDEKAQELEVLESIYADTLEIHKNGTFTVVLQAEEDEDDIVTRREVQFDVPILQNFGAQVTFEHPENYPDEPIIYTIEHVDFGNEEDDDEDHITKEKTPEPSWFSQLNTIIDETIEENMGMAMAFSIATAVAEKLTDLCEELNKQRDEKIEQLKLEEEERHTKKLVGTPVTLETFTVWKIAFQLEMKAKLEEKLSQFEKDMEGRPTGKQLFKNKQAKGVEDDLDVTAFAAEEDKVEVDEKLFEDFEDLDMEDLDGLDDELDSDDEDYVPSE